MLSCCPVTHAQEMEMPITIGCRMDMSTSTYKEVLDQASTSEKLGYDSVWVRDHVSLKDDVGTDDCLECWTVLPALARDCTKVKLGTLVLCNGWRNPALLAKMATSLDVISDGRLIIGLGAGFKKKEWDEYGYDFPSNADRV